MALRNIFLLVARNAPSQRAHFAIFVPSASNPERGTLINAVGAPMVGYKLEFERYYSPALRHQPYEMISIGHIDSLNIVDCADQVTSIDSEPRDNVHRAAAEIPPPRISQNFMAPVNDTANKRCQEWTMEFIRHLVAKGFIEPTAIDIAQSKRDSPTHGIVLRPVKK